jgi:hypothetical protein
MSSPRQEPLLSRKGLFEENRVVEGTGEKVQLVRGMGLLSPPSVSFDLPIQKESYSAVGSILDFQTPPPRGQDRNNYTQARDDALVGAADWQMEISPIFQSRGSDIEGNAMLPISSIASPVGLPDSTHDSQKIMINEDTQLFDASAPDLPDSTHDSQKIMINEDTQLFEASAPDSDVLGIPDPPVVPDPESTMRDQIRRMSSWSSPPSAHYTSAIFTTPPPTNQLSPRSTDPSNPHRLDSLQSAVSSKTSPLRSILNEAGSHDTLKRIAQYQVDQLKTLILQDQNLQSVNFSSSGDLSSARKQVDESSLEFIERIRSAAHRRKVAMTRSRDSLATKEREQLLSIAATKTKSDTVTLPGIPEKTQRPLPGCDAPKQFKARPLPSTTFAEGMGGLVGVPKVSSKPTTTPFSPLLGKRRKDPIRVKALEPPKHTSLGNGGMTNRPTVVMHRTGYPHTPPSSKQESTPAPFKARPLPTSTGMKGNGGLAGVPKVPKRPVTVPFSPHLGPRRRSEKEDTFDRYTTNKQSIQKNGSTKSDEHVVVEVSVV